MSEKLDKALADAKTALVPRKEPDWDAVDAKLFARIEADEKAEAQSRVARLSDRPRARENMWRLAAGGLAAAAAIALFATHKPASAPFEQVTTSAAPAKASALVQKLGQKNQSAGAGSVLVGGASLAEGADLHANDQVETRGATALFERAPASPGAKPAVTWALEDQSRVSITKAVGTLVVALERGAVEAQVTPVPSGEAFAVDVAAPDGAITRVAVHGTHLRVARVESAGNVRLVVDLTEGIVSIGAPPRAGSTYGTLVNAPAHVELDAADPSGTLRVSHAPSDVRAAVDLAPAPVALAQAPAAPQAPFVAPPTAPATPAVKPIAAAAAHSAHDADPDPDRTIAAAVKACMAAHPRPEDEQVKITVSSALELRVNESGSVELARFDPPLPPDVQSCAASTIYKTRFAKGGTVRIPLDFTGR